MSSMEPNKLCPESQVVRCIMNIERYVVKKKVLRRLQFCTFLKFFNKPIKKLVWIFFRQKESYRSRCFYINLRLIVSKIPSLFNSVRHLAKVCNLIILLNEKYFISFQAQLTVHLFTSDLKQVGRKKKLKFFRNFCVILWSKECHTEKLLRDILYVNFNQIRSSQ